MAYTNSYLSYSGRRSFTICPKKYHYQYIIRDKTQGDPRNAMFGIAIGRVFELFYNKDVWKQESPEDAALSLIDESIAYACSDKKFDPSSDSEFISKLHSELTQYIPSTIQAIRKNYLLTVNSRAEVDLTVTYKHAAYDFELKLGGRSDFIHNVNDDTVIVDGKGGVWRQYTDPDQLLWYAVQYYIKYHVVPSRLGFLYYKFPEDPLEWISFNTDSLRNHVRETFEIAKKIRLGIFNARPSAECKLCNFKEKCAEGKEFLLERQVESRHAVENSIFALEKV